MVLKVCFVKSCLNDNQNHPNKIFVRVPLEPRRRKLWIAAANLTTEFYKHKLFACEDHFDLQNDAENWQYYKSMGTYLKLKKDAVPHKNITAIVEKSSESQLSDSAKKRKAENLRLIKSPLKIKRKLIDSNGEDGKDRLLTNEAVTSPMSPILPSTSLTTCSDIKNAKCTDQVQLLEVQHSTYPTNSLLFTPIFVENTIDTFCILFSPSKSVSTSCTNRFIEKREEERRKSTINLKTIKPREEERWKSTININTIKPREEERRKSTLNLNTIKPREEERRKSTINLNTINPGAEERRKSTINLNTIKPREEERRKSTINLNTIKPGAEERRKSTINLNTIKPREEERRKSTINLNTIKPREEERRKSTINLNTIKPREEERRKSSINLNTIKPRFYLGLPSEVFSYVVWAEKHCGVSSRNILLTIKKIRQNVSFERLADDFSMSASNVQKIFTSTIPALANIGPQLIFWPCENSIKKTLPIPFRCRFKNVVSIIDYLEIKIEKSADPVVQALTWSEYKKCNTFKFLISSTPSGMITFLSGAYGGRTCDKDIFVESGFLDAIPEHGKVIADRGFKHVAALLTNKGSELIRPPSVSDGEMSALRVHIEKVIRRVREFQMLSPHSFVDHSLWLLINHILIIVCSIVNIRGQFIR